MPDAFTRYRKRQSRKPSRMRSQTQVLLVCAAGGMVVVVGLVIVLLAGDRGAAPHGKSSVARRSKPVHEPHARRRSPSWRLGSPVPGGPRTLADLLEQPDQPARENGTVTGRLQAARLAMSRRDLPTARQCVVLAVELARSPTEEAEARRAQNLFACLDAFWRAVWDEAKTVGGGRETRISDKVVMIVEAEEGFLVIRVAGKSYMYTIESMPRALAVGLVEQRMRKTGGNADLPIGAFLAVDAQGDRQEARRRWQQAGKRGEALMGELSLAPPIQAAEAPGPQPRPAPAKASE
jgi:hypothetical protein